MARGNFELHGIVEDPENRAGKAQNGSFEGFWGRSQTAKIDISLLSREAKNAVLGSIMIAVIWTEKPCFAGCQKSTVLALYLI